MLTTEQINLVERSVDQIYKRHVIDLLTAIEWVKKLDPFKPNAVGELYEGFLSDTHNAIKKYGEELILEVVRVTTRISPMLSSSEMEQLLSCCERFIDSELYAKRMQCFCEALDRNAGSYGISIDYNAIFFDLYQSRYSAGTINQVREIVNRLKIELDILVLSGEDTEVKVTPDASPSNFGEAINLKPGIFGIGIDLKKVLQWWRNKKTTM